jgi:hypothetical protein
VTPRATATTAVVVRLIKQTYEYYKYSYGQSVVD